MPKQKITGSFVALITPFNKDGSVDEALISQWGEAPPEKFINHASV